MARSRPRLTTLRGVAALLALVLMLIALAPASAEAEIIPFIILIEDGLQFLTQATDSKGLSIWAGGSHTFFLAQNGAKGIALGKANVRVWHRDVPDPFFDPIGPFAALVVLDFLNNVVGHLGLIQTPTDLRTTIGVRAASGEAITGLSGSWVFSDGTTVSGGDANDLVIGGVLVAGLPQSIPGLALGIDLYFPTIPFPSDPTPTSLVGGGVRLGSFYGQTSVNGTPRPVRAYTDFVTGLLPDSFAHFLVIETGTDSYTVVACTNAGFPQINPDRCTVSVPGSAVSGVAHYDVQPLTTNLTLDLFGIVP